MQKITYLYVEDCVGEVWSDSDKRNTNFHSRSRSNAFFLDFQTMFIAVASGNLDLDTNLLGNQPRFLVGALVEVSRRKQEGVNEEDGAAKVERVRGDAFGGFLYDVR